MRLMLSTVVYLLDNGTRIVHNVGMTETLVSAESVKRLMSAKASQLDNYQRTIRNAVRGAKRNGHTNYVGFTYLKLFITQDPNGGGAYRYRCEPDGSVYRYVPPTIDSGVR